MATTQASECVRGFRKVDPASEEQWKMDVSPSLGRHPASGIRDRTI